MAGEGEEPCGRSTGGTSTLAASRRRTARLGAVLEPVQDDLGADPGLGVDLQQQRVPQPAVDDVGLADARLEAVQAGLDLGDHAPVDHALGDQVAARLGGQTADQALGFVPVA